VQVKASGGIRTLEQVLTFSDLGVSRIGTSSTAEILGPLRRGALPSETLP
jgi:deoxyribose-phosphate aldolase